MNSSMAFENFRSCHAFTATIIFKVELFYSQYVTVVIRWFTKKKKSEILNQNLISIWDKSSSNLQILTKSKW